MGREKHVTSTINFLPMILSDTFAIIASQMRLPRHREVKLLLKVAQLGSSRHGMAQAIWLQTGTLIPHTALPPL